jgi:hypothetical protein
MSKEEISTANNMTVTPIRVVTMSNPSVTTLDSPPQMMKTVSSRLSNFSVASLLADNRSVKAPLSPPVNNNIHNNHESRKSSNNVIFNSSNHNHISARLSPSSNNSQSNNNNNKDQFCPSPKNYSISPTVQNNNENNDSNNSIKNADSDLLDRRSQTQTPHSSIASDEYDDSIHDDDDDEDVDIEDVNSENSTNEKRPSLNSSMPHQSLIGGPVPLRPTPFSALAAAAAAWGGMSTNGVPGWPTRQMPPFGPHGLPFPGQFTGQLNGGK